MGAVADDDSGMTDLLGMFSEHGMNTVIFFETQPYDILSSYSKDVEVVAIGTKGRSIEQNEAYRKTKDAIRALMDFGPHMYYLKYCSTFDSTPRGNIGQMIDAGLDLLGGHIIALPALPINGRTTYMGNHFVNGIRLDRSPMKDHPLNPMTEADLSVWLGYQTRRRIGLCDHNAIRKGTKFLSQELKRLSESGVEIIIVDAIDQKDIKNIARSVYDYKLVSGSSALAMELPPIWRENGLLSRGKLDYSSINLKRGGDATLVIAGSCSEATMSQNLYGLKNGFFGFKLDTVKIAEGGESCQDEVERIVNGAVKELRQGKNAIIYTATDMEDVVRTKSLGIKLGLTDIQLGDKISNSIAEIAKALVDDVNLNKFIVAGGETSGAVCRKMKLIGLYSRSKFNGSHPTT